MNMEIQVFRPNQSSDIARAYKLYADDKEVATIKRGETTVVSIQDKTKMLQAKIDWCCSPLFPVSAITSGSITVKNSFSDNLFGRLFLPLYYITFARGRYLVIEDGVAE